VSRDTFVPTKIVLKVDFLERDFKRDHLAEKSNRTKMIQIHKMWLKLATIDRFSNCFRQFSRFSGRGTHQRQF
jgi:hypothetical protein